MTFTYLHRKNRKRFAALPALYASYRQETVCNHGGKKHSLHTFKAELKRVLKHTDECVWSNNPRCFVVLHEEDKILGFADIRVKTQDLDAFFYLQDPKNPPPVYGTVEDFCIAPSERGKGYGRILYDRVETVFKQNATKTVYLTPDPKTGVQFWEKMGYTNTTHTLPDTESYVFRKEIK